MALVRQQTIPTELQPLVGRLSANFLRVEGVAWSARWIPTAVFSVFYVGAANFSFQVAPQLCSRGRANPVPDPLLRRKSGSAGNLIRFSGSVAGTVITEEVRESYHSWIKFVIIHWWTTSHGICKNVHDLCLIQILLITITPEAMQI
jgi:hypothetical protein